MYDLATEAHDSSASIEARIRNTVVELKRRVRMPIAVKALPYFTAFGHVAHELDLAGANGLILFNRFYGPDIDIRTMTLVPRIELSTSAELPLRLHWAALLHGHVRCSIAVTGGVARPTDGVKAILAGAHAVQLVSAILRHGPGYFVVMRDGLAHWLEAQNFTSIDQARGKIDGARDTDLIERANYIRTLQSWKAQGSHE